MSIAQINAALGESTGFPGFVAAAHEAVTSRRLDNAMLSMSFESASLDKQQVTSITDSLKQVNAALADTLKSRFADKDGQVSYAVEQAAMFGAAIGTSIEQFLSKSAKELRFESAEGFVMGHAMPADAYAKRAFGFEAYDTTANNLAVGQNIAFNAGVAMLDPVGDLFYPAIVQPQDATGFPVDINLLRVMEAQQHRVGSKATDFGKKLLVRGWGDPTILRRDETTVKPVYRVQDAADFSANIAPTAIVHRGESIQTAPLRPDGKRDLLKLNQSDSMLAKGVANNTDQLHSAVRLTKVYFKFGPDILSFDAGQFHQASFTRSTQGLGNAITLNFRTTSLNISKDAKTIAGAALTAAAGGGLLKQIDTDNLGVRLSLRLNGDGDTEFGWIDVNSAKIDVVSITRLADGTRIPLDDASVTDLVDALVAGVFDSYEVDAHTINSNMRNRGQLLDRSIYREIYNVPMRDPISAIHPPGADAAVLAQDVQNLVAAIQQRMYHEWIDAILLACDRLREYKPLLDADGIAPDTFGISRWYVKPYFYEPEAPLDMLDLVDSLDSTARPKDIQSAFVNTLRDAAYKMWYASEYQAAQLLTGRINEQITMGILADPRIAQYIMLDGELRTLGANFNFEVVHTLNPAFKGKVFMTFVDKTGTRNSAINELTWGNTHISPEVVMQAQITRENTTSFETIAQPRYFIRTGLCVAALIEFQNLEAVVAKTKFNFHTV